MRPPNMNNNYMKWFTVKATDRLWTLVAAVAVQFTGVASKPAAARIDIYVMYFIYLN